jgi:hypothetical protein
MRCFRMDVCIGEGDEGRLREVCEELLGPVRRAPHLDGNGGGCESPRVLGLDTRKLLSHDVLREISRNRSHQRLVNEFQELLSEIS